ncbi:MAG TPA: DUF6194 family protein [Candidatus Limnocylindrales bacterium]|jgi:Family of unknown function (DUF6194)|nr:DUF6194 family protein [Candidatus Limnocylindrales bacterium]
MSESLPVGPDPEAITSYITTTFPDVDVVSIEGMRFFSLDPEKHWPNFATLVWSDDTDQVSDLSRPGVFRLSMGVNRRALERIAAAEPDPDYTSLDRVLPHPDYARQLWVAILNPSESTFTEVVVPLLAEAYERLAAQRARHPRRV